MRKGEPVAKERTAARAPQATIVQLEVFPSLTVVKGKHVGQKYPLIGDRVVLGRRNGDLTIPDPEVSSTHCEIAKGKDTYFVRDLGSTNGTYVNGQLIREQKLRSGDEIGIGRTVLAFDLARPLAHPAEDGGAEGKGTGSEEGRIPLGLFDHVRGFSGLAALVEDELVGFEDEEGTKLFEYAGVTTRLPPRSEVQLEVLGGPEKGRVITLTSGHVVIGRYGTDIIIKDPDVSRRHLVLQIFGRDQMFLRDLGSTNGCYVNGTKVVFCKLQSGDTLVIGRTVLQLVVKDLN